MNNLYFIIFYSELEKTGYKFNTDMLLIELYENYIYKKLNDKPKEEEIAVMFIKEDFFYLIDFENGRLIDTERSLLEFYFLLLCGEYELAIKLLTKSYASSIKDLINQLFIGDENNLLEQILVNPEIVKAAVELALQRQLDGVAL